MRSRPSAQSHRHRQRFRDFPGTATTRIRDPSAASASAHNPIAISRCGHDFAYEAFRARHRRHPPRPRFEILMRARPHRHNARCSRSAARSCRRIESTSAAEGGRTLARRRQARTERDERSASRVHVARPRCFAAAASSRRPTGRSARSDARCPQGECARPRDDHPHERDSIGGPELPHKVAGLLRTGMARPGFAHHELAAPEQNHATPVECGAQLPTSSPAAAAARKPASGSARDQLLPTRHAAWLRDHQLATPSRRRAASS